MLSFSRVWAGGRRPTGTNSGPAKAKPATRRRTARRSRRYVVRVMGQDFAATLRESKAHARYSRIAMPEAANAPTDGVNDSHHGLAVGNTCQSVGKASASRPALSARRTAR